LALHVYQLAVTGMFTAQAYATAVILLVVVLGINYLSSSVERRFLKRR
jgi:phosphate transport system permease protein